jgi:aspartate aminotransferase
MSKFSKIAENLTGQKMFQILAQAKNLEKQGKDVIHLEIGDPDFNTPQNVKDAACNAIQNNHTHYTISQGLEEFRQQSAKKIKKSRGFLPSVEQILVTPGANIQIYLTLLAVADPGDEIIITDPCFVSYISLINLCNLVPVRVTLHEENHFRLSPDDLKKAVTKKTKLIIINSPNNPTGSVINKDEMRSIYEIAEKNDIYILSDEVYGRMVYEKGNFLSPSSFDHSNKRVIVAHSLSKSYAMTGWRIGALMGPKELVKRMALILETITSCVSPFIQIAAIEAMHGSQSEADEMIKTMKSSRELLVSGLNSIEGISCINPGGSFYAFPNVSGLKITGVEFSSHLLRESFVATCPGFYFGDAGKDNVRFCFATSPIKIQDAIERMRVLFN